MKAKKLIALLLAAVMLMVFVAACVEETPEAPVETPEAPVETPEPTETEEPPEILEPADTDAPANDGGTFSNITTQTPVETLDATPTRENTLIVGYNVPFAGEAVEGWGNSAYDITIMNLLHGDINTVTFDGTGELFINNRVIEEFWINYDGAGNKTYTFRVADGFVWSDGTAITGFDFVAGILFRASTELVHEAGASLFAGQWTEILGREAYGGPFMIPDPDFDPDAAADTADDDAEDEDDEDADDDEDAEEAEVEIPMIVNEARTGSFLGLRMIDDMTFSLTIDAEELPYFFELNMVRAQPIPAHVVVPGIDIITDAGGSRFSADILSAAHDYAENFRFAPPVVAGPYTWVGFDDNIVTVARNPAFGGNVNGDMPVIDFIQQIEVPHATDVDMLFAGEVDLLPQHLDWDRTERVLANPDFNVHDYIRLGYGVINFQHYGNDHLPISDVNVRMAFAHVVDRQAVLDAVLGGRGSLIDTMASPGQWMWQATGSEAVSRMTPYTLNIEVAHNLLDQTEWVFESDGETPFDREQANEQGTYLRHNADSEVLWIRNAAADPTVGAAIEIETVSNAAMAGMRFTSEDADWSSVVLPSILSPWVMTEEERVFSTFSMGTSFPDSVFDPWWLESQHSGSFPTVGWENSVTDELIVNMRRTEGGDYAGFAAAWVEFVVHHNEMVISLPLYNNIWADFYNPRLSGLDIGTDFANWAHPITIANLRLG
ncbi:MAG: ABC transporter substrate-binding protein [Oscillospiraceae bacterium]|nr:ABC transporter substrate-binding protein [Oscillospiraceae bacterium]